MPVGDSLPFMAESSKTGALLTDKIEMSTAIPNIVVEKALHWGSCFAPRPCTPGCDAAGTRGCEQPVWQLLLHPKSCFFPLYVSRLMLWPEIDFAEVYWYGWDLLQEFLSWTDSLGLGCRMLSFVRELPGDFVTITGRARGSPGPGLAKALKLFICQFKRCFWGIRLPLALQKWLMHFQCDQSSCQWSRGGNLQTAGCDILSALLSDDTEGF